jgi:tetratricopeptide (TPR) repeat protein
MPAATPLRRALPLALAALLAAAGARAAGPPTGEKVALLVAVRRYASADLRTLRYTENDVTDLARVLRANGYRPENVVLLTQTAAAAGGERFQPQAAHVRGELRRLLRSRGRADTVLVAFSGHGVQFRKDGEFYFCPADADLSDNRTLVSLSEVYRELRLCPAGFKLLLADACRTDPQPRGARGATPLQSVTRPQVRPVPGGVAAFFSCSRGQEAFEDDRLKHGVFFHYVIEGLRGAAAPPGVREVTLAALQDYVTRRVSDFVRTKLGREQTPELRNQTRGLVALASAAGEAPATGRPREVEARNVALERPGASSAAEAPAPDPRREARELVARGRRLADAGQPAPALALYRRALRLDPRCAEALAYRAEALCDRGAYDQALAACDEALRLDPRLAVAHVFRADALRGLGDTDAAYRACLQALEVNPRLAAAYNALGFLDALRGRTRRGLAELDRAVELDPRDARAYGNRGNIYLELGENDQAVRDFTAALRLNPRDGAAYFFRGLALARLGREREAGRDRELAQQLGFRAPGT